MIFKIEFSTVKERKQHLDEPTSVNHNTVY